MENIALTGKVKISKSIILTAALAFLMLTSGCRTASHLLNPDTYSGDQREPWEKNAKPKKDKTIADQF